MSNTGDSYAQYKTADEVFTALTISEIKSLEIELRSQASSRKTELRLLVGESYRDLLTTADTIVSMRDSSTAVRRQLKNLVAACDGDLVSKKLANLRKFPFDDQDTKNKVMVRYMADLRALIIHFIKKSDLIVAARLYSLGRLVSSTVSKLGIDTSKRLKSVRSILIRAINRCTDVHEFACSFAILESATPQACLKYFLSLQLNNFRECTSLVELTKAILRIMDTTREFAHLAEAFEQIAKKTLISSLSSVAEVDGELLRHCLPDELRHYKTYLRSEQFSLHAIRELVDQWIEASASQLQELTSLILVPVTDIAAIIKESKDVRNLLHEASQESIYQVISPSIDKFMSDRLEDTRGALSSTKTQLLKVINRPEVVGNIWSRKIPWNRGSLDNFKLTTKKILRGDSSSFATFEVVYMPAIKAISTNIEVLGRTTEQAKRLTLYRESVNETVQDLQEALLDQASTLNDAPSIIQILRLLLFITRTSPVVMSAQPHSIGHFRKLIPKVRYVLPSRNYSGTFEHDLPITISPETANYLITFTSQSSDIGIDIIGQIERAELRDVIQSEVQSAVQDYLEEAARATKVENSTNGNGSLHLTNGDGHVEIHSIANQSAETQPTASSPTTEPFGDQIEAQTESGSSLTNQLATDPNEETVLPTHSEPDENENGTDTRQGSDPVPNGLIIPLAEHEVPNGHAATDQSSPSAKLLEPSDIGTNGHTASDDPNLDSTSLPSELSTLGDLAPEQDSERLNRAPLISTENNGADAAQVSSPPSSHEPVSSTNSNVSNVAAAIDLQIYFDLSFIQNLLSFSSPFTQVIDEKLTQEQKEGIKVNLESAVNRSKVQFRTLLP